MDIGPNRYLYICTSMKPSRHDVGMMMCILPCTRRSPCLFGEVEKCLLCLYMQPTLLSWSYCLYIGSREQRCLHFAVLSLKKSILHRPLHPPYNSTHSSVSAFSFPFFFFFHLLFLSDFRLNSFLFQNKQHTCIGLYSYIIYVFM